MNEPTQRVSVSDFRELTAQLLRLVDDWSACVRESERELWRIRAKGCYASFLQGRCLRANARDMEMRDLAERKYQILIAPASTVAVNPPGVTSHTTQRTFRTRASAYNASPGRAVRMARAARSAQRRGYI